MLLRSPTLLLMLCMTSICAAQEKEPPPPAEEIDPDVLRKVRKLIQATLSTEATERDEAWNTLKSMGNLAVPGLVALYRQKDTTPEMMRSVLIVLGDSKDPRAGPALIELLKSKEKPVRRDAARAVGDSGYKDAIPALEKIAANKEEDEEVRLFAAVAGAKLGSQPSLDSLQDLLASQSEQIRSRAVFALGKFGGPKQVLAIEAALKDSSRDVREDAVEGLRLYGKKEAWGPLIKAVSDVDHKIRKAAMDALKELTRQKRIENDPAAWQEWWKKEQASTQPLKE